MAELVRSVTPWLFRICRGYRLSEPTAEDVVQDTVLTLLQHIGTVREPRSVLAWLTVVARRKALRAIRVERRAEPVGDMGTLDAGCSPDDPQRILEARLLRRVLLRNLDKLPERKRGLINLLFLAEVENYATVGELLGMPIGSIGPTRQRGLKRLRELLELDEEWGPQQAA